MRPRVVVNDRGARRRPLVVLLVASVSGWANADGEDRVRHARQRSFDAGADSVDLKSGAGRENCMKRVPPSASADAIYDEILWTRAFTSPREHDP